MRLIRDDDTAKYVIDRYFGADLCQPFAGFTVNEGDDIRGVVVLNNYEQGLSVDLTFAGRLDARSLRELARYAFDGLKVRRVTAVTRESNRAARAALVRFGFHQEGLLRQRFHDENGVLYGLLPGDFPLRF